MKLQRWPLLTGALLLAGCFSNRPPPVSASVPPPALPTAPADMPGIARPGSVPDAVPRVEPRSRSGNPAFYEVFGRRYYVLSSSNGYVERGVASWYGPGFHRVRTSTGEFYDMYGMSAAHKTLPLPAYVRVTNLQNGKSVVVRVNDRGPFVDNRIIDLSFTAATKLDMVKNGTAFVEVRSIDLPVRTPNTLSAAAAASSSPGAAGVAASTSVEALSPPASPGAAGAPPPVSGAPLYIQAGAFSDPANAKRLAERLNGSGYGKIFVRDDTIAGRRMYRVRIGPVPNVADFDRIVAALGREGIRDAHLALE